MNDASLFDPSPEILSALAPLLFFLRSAQAFFAAASTASLLFLAGILYFVGQHTAAFAGARSRGLAKAAGLLAFLTFGLTGYAAMRPTDDYVSRYLMLGTRAAFVLVIVEGATVTALAILIGVWPVIRAPFDLIDRLFATLREAARWLWDRLRWLLRRRPRPLPPPPPPPTLKAILEQAKRDFDATCENLRSAGFDEDELESALLFARQKYLRRVHGIMKQLDIRI